MKTKGAKITELTAKVEHLGAVIVELHEQLMNQDDGDDQVDEHPIEEEYGDWASVGLEHGTAHDSGGGIDTADAED